MTQASIETVRAALAAYRKLDAGERIQFHLSLALVGDVPAPKRGRPRKSAPHPDLGLSDGNAEQA
jgi:hypothetical protein